MEQVKRHTRAEKLQEEATRQVYSKAEMNETTQRQNKPPFLDIQIKCNRNARRGSWHTSH